MTETPNPTDLLRLREQPDLHSQIMNLQGKAETQYWNKELRTAYALGHRDARHAAAELANHAAAIIERQEKEIERLKAFLQHERRMLGIALDGVRGIHERVTQFITEVPDGK